MIPGNIDLTENLDFRRVVQKEIPQLPDSWKGNSINKLNTYLSDNIISLTTSTNSYTSHTYSITNYLNTNDSWMTLSNDSLIESYNITDWNITYDATISQTTINVTYDTDSTIYYNTGSTTYFISPPKKEYDIFGNLTDNTIEEIPKIPWDTEPYKRPIKNICWKSYYGWESKDDYEPSIPWDYYPYARPPKRIDMTDIVDRAKNLICWFRDKSSSFIRNHIEAEEELVDLSYLTNMNWIRVHDAVIDTV